MRLEEGQNNIKSIYFSDNESITVGQYADEIRVTMEYSQVGVVPWFEVIKDGKVISKWNAALCSGVGY